MIEYELSKIGVYFRRLDGIEGYRGEYLSYHDAGQAAIALQKELDAKYPDDGLLVYVEARIRDVQIPKALYKLVNSRDKRWGKHGDHWPGCSRGKGKTLERARQYAAQYALPVDWASSLRHPGANCPVDLTEEEIKELSC